MVRKREGGGADQEAHITCGSIQARFRITVVEVHITVCSSELDHTMAVVSIFMMLRKRLSPI